MQLWHHLFIMKKMKTKYLSFLGLHFLFLCCPAMITDQSCESHAVAGELSDWLIPRIQALLFILTVTGRRGHRLVCTAHCSLHRVWRIFWYLNTIRIVRQNSSICIRYSGFGFLAPRIVLGYWNTEPNTCPNSLTNFQIKMSCMRQICWF